MSLGDPSVPITISNITLPVSATPAGLSGSTRWIAVGKETSPPARTGSVGQFVALCGDAADAHDETRRRRSITKERAWYRLTMLLIRAVQRSKLTGLEPHTK